MYIGEVPKKRFVFPTQDFPKRTRHVLGETSHLLDNTIRIFAGCCCFLFKSFNPLHYKDFEPANATAGYFCLSVCAKKLEGFIREAQATLSWLS